MLLEVLTALPLERAVLLLPAEPELPGEAVNSLNEMRPSLSVSNLPKWAEPLADVSDWPLTEPELLPVLRPLPMLPEPLVEPDVDPLKPDEPEPEVLDGE